MPYVYKVHGRILESAIRFPELEQCDGATDLFVRPTKVRHPASDAFVDGKYATVDEQVLTIAWQNYATFRLSAGRELEYGVSTETRSEKVWLRHALLGAGLGLLMHQRGHLVMHASAVRIADAAILLLGHKGQGKSTTAAALCRRGFELLADDVVTITFSHDDRPYAQPGVASVKLWSDAAAELMPGAKGIRLHSAIDKFVYPLPAYAEALPVRAAIVLATGPETSAAPIHRQTDAFISLLPHLYAPRLIGASAMTRSLHIGLARFLRGIAVYELHRQPGLASLPETLNVIEQLARS